MEGMLLYIQNGPMRGLLHSCYTISFRYEFLLTRPSVIHPLSFFLLFLQLFVSIIEIFISLFSLLLMVLGHPRQRHYPPRIRNKSCDDFVSKIWVQTGRIHHGFLQQIFARRYKRMQKCFLLTAKAIIIDRILVLYIYILVRVFITIGIAFDYYCCGIVQHIYNKLEIIQI